MQIGTAPELPFLTTDLPGTGGVIKVRHEDFQVDEVPLYDPCGEGGHIYVRIQKRAMTTTEMINRICRALKIPRDKVGYAGRKDARAVTKQWISIEYDDLDAVANMDLGRLQILAVSRHGNKIKVGHHRGNRFQIRLRRLQVPLDEALARTEAILERLQRIGAPNFFGPQRFGHRYDSHVMGLALARSDFDRFVDLLLGHAAPDAEQEVVYQARTYYDQGDWEKAAETWPPAYGDQRRALRSLIKHNGDKKTAFNIVDRRTKRFVLSAYQSYVFNLVVAARMPDLGKLYLGDVAIKHENGACFHVDDPAVEQPRADRFEISPSGPLIGSRMPETTDEAAAIEEPVVRESALDQEELRRMNFYRLKGARRALRFLPKEVACTTGSDDYGEYLEVSFRLDPGCYATTLLREVAKDPHLS